MKPTSTLGAGCLVLEQNQVLLVKPNYGKAKNSWILPGGFVNDGELLSTAALRELKEETGQIGSDPSQFCVRYRTDPSDMYWVFQVKLLNKTPLVVQSDELIEVQFLPLEFALKSEEVRPMTRYFINAFLSPNPNEVMIPEGYIKNNFVYFLK
jgi:8-oxo-dGTP diphosphatase